MAEELLEDDTLEAAPVDAEAGDGTAAAPAGADAPATPDGDSTSNGDADPLDQLLADYDRSIGAGGNGADDVDPLDSLIADAGEHGGGAAARVGIASIPAADRTAAGGFGYCCFARDQQIGELQQTVGQLQRPSPLNSGANINNEVLQISSASLLASRRNSTASTLTKTM